MRNGINQTLLTMKSCLAGFGHARQKQLIMSAKLTAIILLGACLQLTARTTAQSVTLSEKKAPLEKIFKQIGKQSGYHFMYTVDVLQKATPVDINVKNMPLEEALGFVFKDQPLTYTIVEKVIVVKEKKVASSLLSPSPGGAGSLLPPAIIDVTLTVATSDNLPLEGASITIKGASKGIVTDLQGHAVLKNIDPNATIVISFTGYISQEVKIANRSVIIVRLNVSTSELDQIQIIAYGTTSKRMSTGNISTVKGEDISKQPVNNPLLALEGRVPGLFITQATGVAGSAVTVRIQGQNSISSGNEPLYIIDGIPYASQLMSTVPDNLGGILGSPLGSATNGNPLSYLNPADIESIDVLKDADATAIYGSRAANGAILITTKKGKPGQTKVDLNVQQGWGKVTSKLDLLSTSQYLDMRRQAFRNDGLAPSSNPAAASPQVYAPDLMIWDTTRYTDWQKVIIGGTSLYSDAQLSISGGNTNTQYLVGGGYHRETSVFPGNFSDTKGSVHFSINNVSANQKFRLGFSGSYLSDNNQLPFGDLTNTAIRLAPDAPALYNADGTLNWANNSLGATTWSNSSHPLNSALRFYQTKGQNIISNAIVSYQLLPGLEIKSSFGYTNLSTNEMALIPIASYAPEKRASSTRVSIFSNNTMNSWIAEPQISYKRVIGRGGKMELLVGSTIQQNNNNGLVLYTTGYSSDALMADIKSASNIFIDGSTSVTYKYNAIFTRLNYNWQDKYIVDIAVRRDGSSRFGPENQFHNFGSIGSAWIFSKETFIQRSLPWISFGKLRASYGTTGNDQIVDYSYLNLFNPLSVGVPYQSTSALTIGGLSNPYLQWEETKKLQAGLDIGILKERILFSANFYYNRSSNELLRYALPINAGFGFITRNFPATLQNSGWEISVSSTNLKTSKLTWTSSFNLTIPENKLVDFPNIASSSYASTLIIGQPVSIVKAYHFLGVDPATGKYIFADINGNTTFSPTAADRPVLINTLPTFYGGLQNSISYKGFQLDFLFQFVKKISSNYLFGSSPGVIGANQPSTVLNNWQKPGDIASIQRFSSANSSSTFLGSNLASIDAAYSDGSYIRLKNVSLSWQIPETWKKKMHFQNCRFYLQAQNLLTITKYAGLDPENASTSSLPMLRVITTGIQLTL